VDSTFSHTFVKMEQQFLRAASVGAATFCFHGGCDLGERVKSILIVVAIVVAIIILCPLLLFLCSTLCALYAVCSCCVTCIRGLFCCCPRAIPDPAGAAPAQPQYVYLQGGPQPQPQPTGAYTVVQGPAALASGPPEAAARPLPGAQW
jgi:hypothetical protein